MIAGLVLEILTTRKMKRPPSIHTLAQQIASRIPGCRLRKSRWSDQTALWCGGREIAHFHGRSAMDVRVGRRNVRVLRHELVARSLVFRPHASDWVEVELRNRAALDALKLCLQMAAAASGGT